MEGKADSALCSEVTPSGCYSYCTPKVEVTVLRESWKVRRTFSAQWVCELVRNKGVLLTDCWSQWRPGHTESLCPFIETLDCSCFLQFFHRVAVGSGQSLLPHSVSWKSSWSSNSSLAVFPERKKISYVTWEVQQIPCCLPTLDFSLTLKKKKDHFFSQRKNDAHSFCSFGNIVERNVSILCTEYILYATYNV